jgi:hypothetical protein
VPAVPHVSTVSAEIKEEARAEHADKAEREARSALTQAHFNELAECLAEAARANGGLPPETPLAALATHGGWGGRWLAQLYAWWLGAHVREGHLLRHERMFAPLLCATEDSLMYRWQVRNQARVDAYTQWALTPVYGINQRWFLYNPNKHAAAGANSAWHLDAIAAPAGDAIIRVQ